MTRPDTHAIRATLFTYGRSQAVHLPEECTFDASEVSIRREGEKVVLEPIASPSSTKRPRRSDRA